MLDVLLLQAKTFVKLSALMFFLRQKHLCSKFRVPLNFEDCLFGSLFFVRTAGRREATINTLPECKITSVRAGQIEGRDVANDVSPSQATSQQHRAKKRKLPNRTNNTHIAEHEKAHNAQLVY